jgi:hypothetical protein
MICYEIMNGNILPLSDRRPDLLDSPEELNMNKAQPYPDPKTANNLLSRLQMFLPQLQAANEALPEGGVNFDKQVDLDLHSDDSDSDDDGDDDDDEITDHAAKRSKTSNYVQEVLVNDNGVRNDGKENGQGTNATLSSQLKHKNDIVDVGEQTIQIQFTLGDMTGNPLMQLLADPDDEADDENKSRASIPEEEDELSARASAVAKLLSLPEELNQESSLSTNSNSARRLNEKQKPLITEL